MNKNYFELLEDKEELQKEIKNLSRIKGLEDYINNYKLQIKEIEKQMNKITSYRNVKIEYDEESGTNITTIQFSKKATRRDIRKFMELNNIIIGYEHYPIYSDYDCTGRVFAVNTKLQHNIITIKSYRDI